MFSIKNIRLSTLLWLSIMHSISFAQPMPFSISNASSNLAEKSNAGDGNTSSYWNSKAPATGWIALDFQVPKTVARLRMLTAQYPAGDTVHNIYGVTEGNQYYQIGQSSKYTSDNQWLQVDNIDFPELEFRYLVVQTTKSPSWVAWREFQVYNGGELRRSCYLPDQPKGAWVVSSSIVNSACKTQGNMYVTFRDVSQLPTGMIVKSCGRLDSPSWRIYQRSRDTFLCYGFQNSANGMPLDNIVWYIKNN